MAILSDLQHQDFTLTDVAGNAVPGVTWNITPAVGTIDAAHGRYIAPGIVTQPQDITITATVAGGAASTALVSLKPVVVTIIPSSVTLRATEKQQFIAQVTGDLNNAVHWVVAPSLGTMQADGLYTAPQPITDDQTLTVTAMSLVYATKMATATVRLLPPPLAWLQTIGIGVYLFCIISVLVFLLVTLWPPPAVDKTNLEKATAERVAAESLLKTKELEAKGAGEQSTQSSALADQAGTDQATKDRAEKDKAAAERAKSEQAAAEKDLRSKLEVEKAAADKVARATEEGVATPLGHLSREIDLLLLALIAGALGTFIHIARSYVDFVGNRTLRGSWGAWYLLYPFIGAALALTFYIAIRGGLLATGMEVNPYGMAALSALVGMFTKQATDKLAEVFSTLFKTDKELKDKLNSG
jgi:hypothetical protein